MSTKPFLIVNIVERELGIIRQRDTWDEAVDCAVEMASEQCNTPKEEIREELERDHDFVAPNKDIRVYIVQAEDN